MIDLNPNHLKTVELILAEHVPDCEVRAFGSRVNWTANDHSDLDLAVCGYSPLSLEVLGNLKEAFEESDLPISVDVLDWHQTSDTFKKIIENHYKQIQTKSNNRPPTDHKTTEPWREFTLGDCATLIRDPVDPRAIPDSLYIGLEHIGKGTLSLIGEGRAADVSSMKMKFRRGDILFGKLRPYFHKVVRARTDGICSTDIWVVHATPKIEQSFLYYCMSSKRFVDYVMSACEGTRMPRAKWDHACDYKLQIPSLTLQRHIARILGTLDDKIELNRRRCETLEEMARALFKSWFVDFDPVRAKAEGRETGLPKHLADLFPDRLEESELGPIPTGWSINRLSQIANHLRKTEDPRNSPTSIFAHFSIPSYDNGQMPVSQYGDLIKSHKIIVHPETVLISRLNPETERTWLVDIKSDQRAVCSTEFLVLNPIKPFTCSYIYCLARSKDFRNQLISLVTGTSKSHQRAPVKSVMNIRVATPPKNLLITFNGYIEEILKEQQTLRNEIPILAALRDELIPRLISGELHVKSR